MDLMLQRLSTIWPEVALLLGAVVCLFTGLAPSLKFRRLAPWFAGAALVAAGILVGFMPMQASYVGDPVGMTHYLKLAIVGLGLLLLLVGAAVPGQLKQNLQADAAKRFEPGLSMRGEFFAFMLFSLTGAMLTTGARDLVWLFLALELTSLPTYVMVAMGKDNIRAQESAVKYFFLGAMAAAVFLYGFAMIYGATGYTDFAHIQEVIRQQIAAQNVSPLLMLGVVLSVVGLCFKIAAFPMHFYAADVYEGAATPVTAFLAFVPKAAGFAGLILILGLIGWPLPPVLAWLLWVLAVLTMTLGNVLGLLQKNVKRVLAYSSIAHSGYMLVGLLAGLSATHAGSGPLTDGIAAVLFYLVAYGLGTIGSFAVLGLLQAGGEEAQTYDDLAGLASRRPLLAAVMLLSVLSLMGIPPLIGFLGKIYLFVPAFEQGYVALVVIAVINSAISAVYYLHIAGVCFLGSPRSEMKVLKLPARTLGAVLAAAAVLVLGIVGSTLVQSAYNAMPHTVAARTPTAVHQTMAKVPLAAKPSTE